ncbi:MAG: GlxA family transcriptional regulator [Vulcanimicrobiaceae bacterium]
MENRINPHGAQKLRIGFILAPRFTLTAFAGFVDALRLAADEDDRSRRIDCDWVVLGDADDPVVSSCGVTVQPWKPMERPGDFDYIVVVGGLLHGGQKVLPGTNAFLRRAARARIPLVGLCTGSFILARAGLMDGYSTCVSWFHRDEFMNEFPTLRAETNHMFLLDRDRMTCAGGTSVVHLAAHLIERHFGREKAIKSLRIMIEDSPVPSNAWQPEAIITRPVRDNMVREAMLIIEQNLAEPHLLSGLSGSLGVSARQIERRFVGAVGMTPREYRLRLRLSRAKWMLEHTDRSVTEIGLDCGFTDCSHFSRTFRDRFQVQPSSARGLTV